MKEAFSYHLNTDEFELLIKLFEAAPQRSPKRGARARRQAKRTQGGN